MLRHGAFGAPCGYVELPKNHRLYKCDACLANELLDVHGGVTWCKAFKDDEKKRFWIGFDMAHYYDFDPTDMSRCIRTDEECIEETERLARQLAKFSR